MILHTETPGSLHRNDAGQNVWGSIETNAGIVCACAPTLKPFFIRYIPVLGFASRNQSAKGARRSSRLYVPYSTVVERNRRRRDDQRVEGLELTSKDGPNGSAVSLSNDEAALWSDTRWPAEAAPTGFQDLVAPWQNESGHTSERDRSKWRRNINIAATDYNDSPHRDCNGGIVVDHETTVVYEA